MASVTILDGGWVDVPVVGPGMGEGLFSKVHAGVVMCIYCGTLSTSQQFNFGDGRPPGESRGIDLHRKTCQPPA